MCQYFKKVSLDVFYDQEPAPYHNEVMPNFNFSGQTEPFYQVQFQFQIDRLFRFEWEVR